MRTLLRYLRSNWISFSGAWVTTLAFFMMVTLFVVQAMGYVRGPYSGLILLVILPGLFAAGLLMIPAGLVVYRHRTRERIAALKDRPLHVARTIGVLTVVNVLIVGVAGYHGHHYTDSVEFCGTLCHEVMDPYYRTYLDSPHARVSCVDCHIGPGASWFVQSKLSGLRQVLAVMSDDFSRPIPTPVANLRPARDTCEQCHWPEKFVGDEVVVRRRHKYDRESTPYAHVLVMRTGGVHEDGEASGIHWHVHSRYEITFRAADRGRREIPWVRLHDRMTGEDVVFAAPGVDPDSPPDGEVRTMDCVDCHNSPSHVFRRSWESIDEAIAGGRISRGLPFVKKIAREVIERPWESPADAEEGIARAMAESYPDREGEDRERATAALVAIWKRNVHPGMKIGWNAYPSFAGHAGCFRCHDDDHRSRDGRRISMDCETCHAMLAYREEKPTILDLLGESVE